VAGEFILCRSAAPVRRQGAYGCRRDRTPTHGLRVVARGRDGGVREELAAGVVLRSGGRSAFGGKPEIFCSL